MTLTMLTMLDNVDDDLADIDIATDDIDNVDDVGCNVMNAVWWMQFDKCNLINAIW